MRITRFEDLEGMMRKMDFVRVRTVNGPRALLRLARAPVQSQHTYVAGQLGARQINMLY
jgi:hypothetical protein